MSSNVIKVDFAQRNPMIKHFDEFKHELDNQQVYGAIFLKENYDGDIALSYVKSPDEDLDYIKELLRSAIDAIDNISGDDDESEGFTP